MLSNHVVVKYSVQSIKKHRKCCFISTLYSNMSFSCMESPTSSNEKQIIDGAADFPYLFKESMLQNSLAMFAFVDGIFCKQHTKNLFPKNVSQKRKKNFLHTNFYN